MEEPSFARFLHRLASFSRLIVLGTLTRNMGSKRAAGLDVQYRASRAKPPAKRSIRVGSLDNVVKLWPRGALECGFRSLSGGGPRFGPASKCRRQPTPDIGGGSAVRCAGPSKPQRLIGPSASASVVPPQPSQVHTGAGIWTFGRSSGAGGLVRRPAILHSCSRATRRR
jgi:hypothetical protein